LLTLHLLLLCAAGRTPTEIAAVLFCSRSSVYRVGKAYRAGQLEGTLADQGGESARAGGTVLSPALKRSLLAILKAVPRACGWCRTRWSCATVALEVQARRGVGVSAETVRRWRQELGWEWKRAQLVAQDNDPQRVETRARIRYPCEQVRAGMVLVFADELAISRLPKVGSQWMPTGEQVEVLTPGTNEKRYRAGARAITTGTTQPCVWDRKTTGLFLDLLATLDREYPARAFSRLSVGVDNSKIHQAIEVDKGGAAHPRVEVLFLPTYCPKANPMERACGDVHDKGTRNHTRKRIRTLVGDVEQPLAVNGPWP
jgi:transposase